MELNVFKVSKHLNEDGTHHKDGHGNFYFTVEFNNGVSGSAASKSETPWWQKSGTVVDVTDRGEEAFPRFKISRPQTAQATNSQPSNPVPRAVANDMREVALTITKDLASFGHVSWVKTKPDFWVNVQEVLNYLQTGNTPEHADNS